MLIKPNYCSLIKRSIIPILGLFISFHCYSQQSESIDIEINNLKIQNHKLYSRYQQPKNMLEAYWGEWSVEKKTDAEKWFEFSEYNPDKLRRKIQWLESEYEADKKNWNIIIASTGIVDSQKKAYLTFLKDENKLLSYKNIYWGNKLHAIRMYGGDWVEEFAQECVEDFAYVFIATVKNLINEFKNCISVSLSEVYKNVSIQIVTHDLDSFEDNLGATVDKFTGCLKKVPLRSIVFALDAALKRQFIKEMNDKGIDDLVAEYWYDVKIMKKAKVGVLEKSAKNLEKLDFWAMNALENKFKDMAENEVIPQMRKDVEYMYKNEFKKRILDKGLLGTTAGKNFRHNALKSIKKTTVDRLKNSIITEMYLSLEFTYEYLKKGYTFREGYYNFSRTVEVDVASYKHVKKCLARKNIPATPEKMLEIMKKEKKEFLTWFRDNCNEKECSQEDQLRDLLAKISENEQKIDKLANDIMGQCSRISSLANSARQAVINAPVANGPIAPNSLFEGVQVLLEQKIASLELLLAKSQQNSVGTGIYKSYTQNKALQACNEINAISNSQDETQQLTASMNSLTYMADATKFSSFVTEYYDETISLGNTARQIQSDVLAILDDYNSRLANSVNSNLKESEMPAIINLFESANGLYHTNGDKLKSLEDEMTKFKNNYELALTIVTEESKISQLKMLHDRLTTRLENSRSCHEESGALMHQIEVAISKISIPETSVSPKPGPILSSYGDRANNLLNEIELNVAEVQGYQTESKNALFAARSCMQMLLDLLPESTDVVAAEEPADINQEKETVSGGGFVEISQDGGIAEGEGKESIDPDIKESMEDYYKAQRLSNYGTKGFNKYSMQIYVNDLLAQQRNENAQAIGELNNIAIDMIKSSAQYYGEMAIDKKRSGKTAKEEFADKYLSTSPYKKYYDGFNIDPERTTISSSGMVDSRDEEFDPWANGALNLMNVDATPFTDEYQTGLGEIDSQEAASLQDVGASVPDYCIFYYYNQSEKKYEYAISDCSDINPKYIKVYGPATRDSCSKWLEVNKWW